MISFTDALPDIHLPRSQNDSVTEEIIDKTKVMNIRHHYNDLLSLKEDREVDYVPAGLSVYDR